jgi:hypothetical protein
MSAVNRFLISVPTAGRGGMPIGWTNNASRAAAALRAREAAALRAIEVEARRAALNELIQKKQEKLLLDFCSGGGENGNLSLCELRDCLFFLKSDVFCSSITDVTLKTQVDFSRVEMIGEVTVLIQNISKKNEDVDRGKKKALTQKKKALQTTSHLPNAFENHVWSEICQIREMMVNFAKSELQRLRKVPGVSSTVPTLKKEVNMSEKAMNKALFDHDEREDDDDDGSDSSDDDDQYEDRGFSAKKDQKKKNLKNLVRDDADSEKKMSMEENKTWWTSAAGGAAGGAAGEATKRMSQREKNVVDSYHPTFETAGSKAAFDFSHNQHVHVLKKRMSQILRLWDYWKRIREVYDLTNQIITVRIRKIHDEVETKLLAYERKYKKIENKEMKNKRTVILDESQFRKGEEMDLYWIEDGDDGEEEYSLLTDLTHISQVPEFVREYQLRVKKDTKVKTLDRYVITMRLEDFNILDLNEIQKRKLNCIVLERENKDAADYIQISLNKNSRNWHIQRHVQGSDHEGDSSDSSIYYSKSESNESSDDSIEVEEHDDDDDQDAEFDEPVDLDKEEEKALDELRKVQMKLDEIATQRLQKKARNDAGGS